MNIFRNKLNFIFIFIISSFLFITLLLSEWCGFLYLKNFIFNAYSLVFDGIADSFLFSIHIKNRLFIVRLTEYIDRFRLALGNTNMYNNLILKHSFVILNYSITSISDYVNKDIDSYEIFTILRNELDSGISLPLNLAIRYGQGFVLDNLDTGINSGRQIYYRGLSQETRFILPISGSGSDKEFIFKNIENITFKYDS